MEPPCKDCPFIAAIQQLLYELDNHFEDADDLRVKIDKLSDLILRTGEGVGDAPTDPGGQVP